MSAWPPSGGEPEQLAQALARATARIDALVAEIEALRDDLGWAVRQLLADRQFTPGPPLTSLPRDPRAADFGAGIHRDDHRAVPAPSGPPPRESTESTPAPPPVAEVPAPPRPAGRGPSLFD